MKRPFRCHVDAVTIRPDRRNFLIQVIITTLVSGLIALSLSSCQTKNVTRKAEELRRSGAAKDMAEAIRMAEDYHWPESARTKESVTNLDKRVP